MSATVPDDILKKINKSKIPNHVAVIMDGNGRWAKKIGKERFFGHNNGVNSKLLDDVSNSKKLKSNPR